MGGEELGKPCVIEPTLNLVLQMMKSNRGTWGGGLSWKRAAQMEGGGDSQQGVHRGGGEMEGTSQGRLAQYCLVGGNRSE